MLTYVLAVLAACANATSSVLQRKANRRAPQGLTLSDPIVSILWGVLVFGERVRDGWHAALAAVSGVVMTAAVVALARSPLLSDESARQEEEPRPAREGSPAQ